MTIAQLHQTAQRAEPGTTERRRLCRGTVEGKCNESKFPKGGGMTKKEVRRIRKDTAARNERSANGAANNHTTLTRRQTAALLAAGVLFAAIVAVAEWGWRACV